MTAKRENGSSLLLVLQWAFMLLMLASCLTQSLPKYFYDDLLLAGIPIYTHLAVATVLTASPVVFRIGMKGDRAILSIVLILVLGSLLGIANQNSGYVSMRDASFDVLTILAAASGYSMAITCRTKTLVNILPIVQISMAVMIFASTLLIQSGRISTALEGTREFDLSMFFSAGVATWLLPVTATVVSKNGKPALALIAVCLTTLAILLFCEISATRNVLLLIILSSSASVLLIINNSDTSIRIRLLVSVMIIGAAGAASPKLLDSLKWAKMDRFRYRIESEGFRSESRLKEAEVLFVQHGLGLFVGKGLGAGFHSNVVTERSPDGYSTSLHIGILTPLLKAGIPGILILVVIPTLVSALAIRDLSQDRIKGALAVGFLLYIVQASLSGGYHYSVLLVAGMLFGGVCRKN